jgi:ATP:ADP antiporter, AAA family
MSSLLGKIKLPIQRDEWPKFLFTASMMLLVVYVYSILRASKDTVVVTLMGAELINTLKLYGTLPTAVLFMLIYTKLVDIFPKTQLFHIINWFFVLFFIAFAFILFPNAKHLHFDVRELMRAVPYLSYLIMMLGNWTYSLFYILSELWGSVMLSLIFWQLANQITTIPEAKRFYPLFGLLAQSGFIGAGCLMQVFTAISRNTGGWSTSLNYIAISVLIAGVILSFCMVSLTKIAGADLINGKINISGKAPKKRVKMGFIASIKYIMSSKYIGLIASLILCYGVSINLVEGVWKKAMHMVYPLSNDYAAYMGKVMTCTGIATAIAMLGGAFILRHLRWKTAAFFTPIIICITGIAFFVFIVYRDALGIFVEIMGLSMFALATFFGTTQNVLSKSTKYAFFDPTKEMSYIPLDEDLKAKGKAAADVVGGRLGKSGGAFIQWILVQIVFLGSSLIDVAPYMFAIFVVTMFVWFFAVSALSKEFVKKSAEIGHHEKT